MVLCFLVVSSGFHVPQQQAQQRSFVMTNATKRGEKTGIVRPKEEQHDCNKRSLLSPLALDIITQLIDFFVSATVHRYGDGFF